jgi:phage minor structural protein
VEVFAVIPILYDDLEHAALGNLPKCFKADCFEALNGEYYLDLETTINEPLIERIRSQNLIGIKANPFDGEQKFEIKSTKIDAVKGIIKIKAKHIRCLAYNYWTYVNEPDDASVPLAKNATPAQTWAALWDEWIPKSPAPVPLFNFYSDITNTNNVYLGSSAPEQLGNILGGKEGSFLDVYGGEYHYDNLNINLLRQRGTDRTNELIIRYGANVSDSEQFEDSENVYTHILPCIHIKPADLSVKRWYMPTFAIPIHGNERNSNRNNVYLLDLSDEFGYLESENDRNLQYDNYAVNLITARAEQIASRTKLGKRKVGITVNVPAMLDSLQNVAIGDTVSVELNAFGETTTAKITQGTYDVLNERWKSLTFGERKLSLADVFLKKERFLNNAN